MAPKDEEDLMLSDKGLLMMEEVEDLKADNPLEFFDTISCVEPEMRHNKYGNNN